MEDFDEGRHPQLLANKTVAMAGPNESFKALKEMIKSTKTEDVTDKQLNEELNAFMNYERDGLLIFKNRRPNVEEWKTRRDNYLIEFNYDDIDPANDVPIENNLPTEPKWFHDMRISVFMRKPFNVPDEKYRQLADKVKAYLPSFNWEELTQYIEHKDENCIRGDIFKHPSAKMF